MPTIQANGIELYYEEHGQGEPLLLMAATGWPGRVWEIEQVPFFKQHYRVIVYDQRGVGRSDKPDHEYTVDMLADDALGLLHAIDAEPAHLLGFSMGGRVAQVMALKSPASVRSLVLAAASPGRGESRGGVPLAVALSLGEHGYGLEFWLDHFHSRDFPFSRAFREGHPEKVQALAECIYANQPPLKHYLRHVLARGTHTSADRLAEIQAPTLVMVGSGDHGSSSASGDHLESARFFVQTIPNAELALVEGAHHLFPWEAPEQTNEIVLEFLRGTGCRLNRDISSDKANYLVAEKCVQWGDCDPAGIAFYPRFFEWMDLAAHVLIRELGLSTEELLAARRRGFPLVSAQADFLAPARMDDRLEIRLSVTRVGRTSVGLRYEFWRVDDGQTLLARGREERVQIQRDEQGAMASRELTDEMRAVLARYQDPESGSS